MLFLRFIRIDLTHLTHLILLVHPIGPGGEWDRVPFVATSRVLGPYGVQREILRTQCEDDIVYEVDSDDEIVWKDD